MKHFQPPVPMLSDDQVKAALREHLDGSDSAKIALAGRLGISTSKLTRMLRGQIPVCDQVAAHLGFKRVIMFEPVAS